jgi:hypothetical protein
MGRSLEGHSALATQAPEVLLQQMIAGYVMSQAVYVAAKLGVADLIDDRCLSSQEIAERTGADAGTLHRFLRALAAVGVFEQDSAGRFGLGPLGAHLRTGVDGSLRAYAIHANEECYRAWGEALQSACTGRPGFEAFFGAPFYTYMADHPEGKLDLEPGRDRDRTGLDRHPGLGRGLRLA